MFARESTRGVQTLKGPIMNVNLRSNHSKALLHHNTATLLAKLSENNSLPVIDRAMASIYSRMIDTRVKPAASTVIDKTVDLCVKR